MRLKRAVDHLHGGRTIHAVPVAAPAKTLCRIATASLVVSAEDWEAGPHRLSCSECVDRAALHHFTCSRALAWPEGATG